MKKLVLTTVLTLSVLMSFAQNNRDNQPTLRLVRNATLIIEYGGKKILVDPMLSDKGAIESWAGIQRNPTVDLKTPAEEIVKGVDLVMVSHTHDDHFDKAASKILDKSIPLINQPADHAFFAKEGFTNAKSLADKLLWNKITIQRVEGQHGTGEVLKLMGKTSGFLLKAKNHPTIYIMGDAIWTEEIKNNIRKFKPDYIIVNSGGAQIQGFENLPIIMDEVQTMALIGESGNAKVIAVHMDALDHCRTTRKSLRQKAAEANIGAEKLIIPEDGETIKL